jgi:predicted permease
MVDRLAREFAADVRLAIRQMRRRLGFTATVVLTLGLGIGATVALLSVVNDLLLRPLPYSHEDRVRVFWMDYDWRGDEYDFVRQRHGVFESVAAFSTNGAPYHASTRAEGNAVLLPFVVTTSSLFDVLGARPYLGRTLQAGDDQPGTPPVIVVSYGMWKQDLGGDAGVIGRQILIDGKEVTVVGVMPKSFYFPTPDFRAWRPVQLDPSSSFYRNVGYLTLMGRVRAGIAPALVERDVQQLGRLLGDRFTYTADVDKTKHASTTAVRTYLLGTIRAPLILLLAATGLLLLIACSNAAALILARTSDRSGELALRVALGAERQRIARQIFAESVVLALGAALLGTVIAVGGFSALVASLPLQNGFNETVTMGWVTFAAAFALALVVAAVVSAVPIRNLLRGRLDAAVGLSRERSEAGLRRGTRRVHGGLVVGQVTLAVLLVAGATLLIRSVERLQSVNLGFEPRGVSSITLLTSDAEPVEARRQFFRDVVGRVSALPGVIAAGLTNRLPVRDAQFQGPVQPEGRPDLDGPNRPNALFRIATPEYFHAMGIRLRAGRTIDSTDGAHSLPVAVINESFARRMWPGQSALGKHVRSGYSGTMVSYTIVGVAAETRLTSITGEIPFAMWVPFEQTSEVDGEILVVRAEGDPGRLTTAVRRIAAGLDPQVAVTQVQTMEQVLAASLAQPLRLRFFLALFAALALALGGIGVYGVVSYAVTRRRAEYAIRVALGASPGRVRGEVFRHGLAPVAVGTMLGVVGALLSARLLTGFLFGVRPTDPASLSTAAGLLLLAGVLAALAPALRAGRTNPATALRSE